MSIRQAYGVYKQNNCVHCALISKLLLLQHDVHNYCIYEQHWPDKTQFMVSVFNLVVFMFLFRCVIFPCFILSVSISVSLHVRLLHVY